MTIPFTQAQVKRAVKGAREADPHSVIEITESAIRILPAETLDSKPPKSQGQEPDDW